MVEREFGRREHYSAVLAGIAIAQQNVLPRESARLVRNAAIFEQTNYRRQPHRQSRRVKKMSVLFFGDSHAFQHEYERPPRGADIDGLIRGIQHEHRRLHREASIVARHNVSREDSSGAGMRWLRMMAGMTMRQWIVSRHSPCYPATAFTTASRTCEDAARAIPLTIFIPTCDR